MKPIRGKKLLLNRETLRNLAGLELEKVLGGKYGPPVSHPISCDTRCGPCEPI